MFKYARPYNKIEQVQNMYKSIIRTREARRLGRSSKEKSTISQHLG